jgi:hypothetical protein
VYFQSVHLLRALRAGEPYRLARAIGLEAVQLAFGGTHTRAKTAALLERAEALARESGHPHGLGFLALSHCVKAYLEGRWADAVTLGRRAVEVLRGSCTGVHWEVSNAQAFSLWSMLFLGELNDLRQAYPRVLAEARERGDLYAIAYLGTAVQPYLTMTEGRTEEAREELRRVTCDWTQQQFSIRHFNATFRTVELALYEGDGRAAQERAAESVAMLRPSGLARLQLSRMTAWYARGRAAVISADRDGVRGGLRTVEADARRLDAEDRPDATAMAAVLRAAVCWSAGDRDRAVADLCRALAGFEAADMKLYAAAVRRRLGEATGGDEGAALVAAADAFMTGQGVVAPRRMTAVYAPGFDHG